MNVKSCLNLAAAFEPALRGARLSELALSALLALAAVFSVLPKAWAATYTVTSATDDGGGTTTGTLSWAITQANGSTGNTIAINLNSGHKITLPGPGAEPTISRALTIDNAADVTIAPTLTAATLVALTKTGAGALKLAGNNSQLKSGVTLSDGVLNVGNASNRASVTGNVGSTDDYGTDGGDAVNAEAGTTLGVATGSALTGGQGGDTKHGSRPGAKGGAGIRVDHANVHNSGTVTGGRSGRGSGTAGYGGHGGAGMVIKGGTLSNNGTISGGFGESGSGGYHGSGGTGIVASDGATLVVGESGTVTGGTNAGHTRANAIELSNGNNQLTIKFGATIKGNVVSTSGTANGGDTLALGGDQDAGFDVSRIGASSKYQGFAKFAKIGSSTWTLTGPGKSGQNWTVNDGTLKGDTNSLQGDITDNANLTFDQSSDDAFSSKITGTGSLTKTGAGTLTLANSDNSYSGGTIVKAGMLGGRLPDNTDYTVNGGTLDLSNSKFNLFKMYSLSGTGGTLALGNAALIVNQVAGGTFSGDITGTGSLTKTGGATLSLLGSNTYSGGTTVAAGQMAGNTDSLQGDIIDNANVAFYQNTNGTYAGDLSGTGSLSKGRGGTVVLAGKNTYSGATFVNGGTLRVGAKHALPNGGAYSINAGILDLNGYDLTMGALRGNAGAHLLLGKGHLTLDQAIDTTYAGDISGSGSFQKIGPGTLTLTGHNTASGGANVVDAGRLVGNTDSLKGNIHDNARVMFYQPTDGIFGGDIAGTGHLTKAGDGTLTLNGANSYSGGTLVAAGTLKGDSQSIQGDIADDANVTFDQTSDGTFGGDIAGSGSLIKTGGGVLSVTGDNAYQGGTTVKAGMLKGDTDSLQGEITNNGAVAFDQSSDGVFGGRLGGAGRLVKNGRGQLTFNSVNSMSGPTSVNGGSLIVGSDARHAGAILAGPVAVAHGATLGGHGHVGSIDDAGTLSPGNSIGTLHVNGNYTARPGSTLKVEVDPQGRSDRVDVAGKVDIKGGTVSVQAAKGDYAPHTRYTLITAAQGVNGRFNGLTTNLAFLDPRLLYRSKAVGLLLTRNDIRFASRAHTSNQRTTAAAIGALGAANPVYRTVAMLSAVDAPKAFDTLSGQSYASEQTALLHDSHFVRDAVSQRLSRGCATGERVVRDARTCGRAIWVSGYGDWGHWQAAQADRLDHNAQGGFIGADTDVSDWRLGFVAGAGHSRSSVHRQGARSQAEHYQAGFYAGRQWQSLGFEAGAAYGWDDVSSHRDMRFPGFDRSASANYHVRSAQVYAGLDYQLALGATAVTPFVRAAFVHLDTGDFREHGTMGALENHGQSNSVGISKLGVKVRRLLSRRGSIRFHAHGSAGWRHITGDKAPEAELSFDSAGQRFTQDGTPLARNAAILGVGLDANVGNHFTAGASYVGQFGGGAQVNGVQANVAWHF